eukprot:2513607-Rhodomonas_salina.2
MPLKEEEENRSPAQFGPGMRWLSFWFRRALHTRRYDRSMALVLEEDEDEDEDEDVDAESSTAAVA